MRTSHLARAGALAAVWSVLALSAAPAHAADPVAQATATALSGKVNGEGADTGTYRVVHDGTRENVSGTSQPSLSLLTGQRLASVGTLAQDAVTAISDGQGTSSACAGVAGHGATVVGVGSGRCITGGDTVALGVANLDLRTLQISPQLGALEAGLAPVLTQVKNGLSDALQQAVTALGNPALTVGFGAVQASCTADASSATGYANIANAGAFIDFPAQTGLGRVEVARFPAEPAPNTKVVTGLDEVVGVLLGALKSQLSVQLGPRLQPLEAALQGLGTGVDQLRTQLVDTVVKQVADELGPVEENLLDATLNKQSGSGGFIDVTALDVQVLPAARRIADHSLVDLQVGRVTCGPHGRIAAAAPAPAPRAKEPKPRRPAMPPIPSSVLSGAASFDEGPSPLGLGALAGLVVLAAGAGVAGFRRSLRR